MSINVNVCRIVQYIETEVPEWQQIGYVARYDDISSKTDRGPKIVISHIPKREKNILMVTRKISFFSVIIDIVVLKFLFS